MKLKLLSWNVHFRKPSYRIEDFGSLIKKIESECPKIVTLQEVKRNLADDWAKHLSEIGLVHHYPSGENGLTLSHQCLIASCWELTPNDIPRPREPPYPESLGRATVALPGKREIDVFTAHIPNGIGNGWRKIDTLHVLAAELRRAKELPRVLTGDFNEPEWHPKLDKIKVWGEGNGAPECWRDKFGDERPSIEWATGVRSVLDCAVSKHRLRDAYRHRPSPEDETPDDSTPITYITPKGNPRCFDHTFVSRHFDVVGCGYHDDWRKWHKDQRLSDHSAMWAELRLRTDHPKQWEDDCA